MGKVILRKSRVGIKIGVKDKGQQRIASHFDYVFKRKATVASLQKRLYLIDSKQNVLPETQVTLYTGDIGYTLAF